MRGGYIKAGDLVMVVKPLPCCGHPQGLGKVYRALEVYFGLAECVVCGRSSLEGVVVGSVDGSGFRPSVLKKIDPPAEGETREAYKHIKVPA